MDTVDATGPQPLDVVVRFSSGHPDLLLHVNSPAHVTGLALRQQIRARLEPPASESRLRLIYAGKILNDSAALSQSLKGFLNPPPLSPSLPQKPHNSSLKSGKAKGKQPLYEHDSAEPSARSRVYIHCSVTDVLSESELALEDRRAKDSVLALHAHQDQTQSTALSAQITRGGDAGEDVLPTTSTTPAPRGFDRLLSAGFTPAEVATLRTQFLAIQAHTHTPDTMPSGAELLVLEERWLDDGSNAGAGVNGQDGGEGGFTGDDTGGLDDMLYGNLIGFFWPIGAMAWLMREEGVWSRRRRIAVLSGLLVNLAFGWIAIK